MCEFDEEQPGKIAGKTQHVHVANERLHDEACKRQKAEARLVQTEGLTAMGEMSAGVVHDFNNYLQAVVSAAKLAVDALESGNVSRSKELLGLILLSSEHAGRTIERLRNFSRISVRDARSLGKVFDLSQLARQAASMAKTWLETLLGNKGINVGFSADLDDGCFVRGIQSQLFEALLNLIKNAAEAIDKDGEITLSTHVDRDKVVLQVSDTGVGIPEHHMVRLFSPFFTTKGQAGTGLGLTTTQSIVEGHGGSIRVESVPRLRTTFTVVLPLEIEAESREGLK
jgi:signal transduction histidine kinase